MRNKFPGTCYQCGKLVKKGEGHFQRHHGSWIIHHAFCAIKNREERKNKKESKK